MRNTSLDLNFLLWTKSKALLCALNSISEYCITHSKLFQINFFRAQPFLLKDDLKDVYICSDVQNKIVFTQKESTTPTLDVSRDVLVTFTSEPVQELLGTISRTSWHCTSLKLE